MPPSMTMAVPLVQDDSSDARVQSQLRDFFDGADAPEGHTDRRGLNHVVDARALW